MARISGIDLPKNKRGVIALTYIFGLGRSRAIEILEKAQVSQDKKVQDWNDDEIGAIPRTLVVFDQLGSGCDGAVNSGGRYADQ